MNCGSSTTATCLIFQLHRGLLGGKSGSSLNDLSARFSRLCYHKCLYVCVVLEGLELKWLKKNNVL